MPESSPIAFILANTSVGPYQPPNSSNEDLLKRDRRSKHLKKYWRLLQKNAWKLKGQHRYWRPSFRDHLTEAEIVDRLLSYG